MLGYRKGDDGVFHMSWEDFITYFNTLDICLTTSKSISNLQLDSCEDYGLCGVILGFLSGCVSYWFCMFGCINLWHTHLFLSSESRNEQGLSVSSDKHGNNGKNSDMHADIELILNDEEGYVQAEYEDRSDCFIECCNI